MLVLGIESSCDETGLAVLHFDSQGRAAVRSEVLRSQIDLHKLYGGVVPELAAREHMQSLPLLCEEVLSQAQCELREINVIGVTQGPGLKGCLLIGVTFGQGLIAGLSSGTKPALFGVNHIEAHILTGELHKYDLKPPYLALVVSGGHTEVIKVSALGTYEVVYRTLDDAAGEAFDKSANLLGFDYPGGATLAQLADTVTSSRFTLPKVSREIEHFSFSGLKTAVMLLLQRNREEIASDLEAKAEAAFAIQRAIIDPLVLKTSREVKRSGLPLVVCGGVSANNALRKALTAEFGSRAFFPPLKHCVDNGAMIAYVAGRYSLGNVAPSSLEIRSRWGVETLTQD